MKTQIMMYGLDQIWIFRSGRQVYQLPGLAIDWCITVLIISLLFLSSGTIINGYKKIKLK